MKKIFMTTSLMLLIISCTLFPKEEKLLAEVETKNHDKLRAYYLSFGATTNDVVQLRKVSPIGEEQILKVYENYTDANLHFIKDTLFVILFNGFGSEKNRDTITFF